MQLRKNRELMNYIKHLESKIYNYSLKYNIEDVSMSEQRILSDFEKLNAHASHSESYMNFVYMQAATIEEMYDLTKIPFF